MEFSSLDILRVVAFVGYFVLLVFAAVYARRTRNYGRIVGVVAWTLNAMVFLVIAAHRTRLGLEPVVLNYWSYVVRLQIIITVCAEFVYRTDRDAL